MRRKTLETHAAALIAVCVLTLSACQHSSLMNARAESTSSTSSSTSTSTATAATGSAYYVSTSGSDSSGNGSKTSPWATIAHASTKVGAGATVYVAPGVYNGSFDTNASGTASAYITYAASTTDFSGTVNCAQIAADQGSLSGCAQLVGSSGTTWSNMGNYVAIEGFDVTGPGINGIYTQGDATFISGNHVHNLLTSTCNSTGGSGINLNGTNAEVVGNYVHDIGPYPTSCGYVQGIYFLQAGGYAYNNISFNNSGFGIQMWHYPSNLEIFNNTIFNNASGGIVLGTDDSGVVVDYITVANNIVVNNGGAGVSEQGATSSSTGTHNVYENNLVQGNSGSAFSLNNGLKAVTTITSAPQFVNDTGTSTGNYHLLSTSPAIGAGLTSGAPSTDFDGNSRPSGGPITIGAYQTAGSTSTSTSTPTGPSAPAGSTPASTPTIAFSPTSIAFSSTQQGSTSAIKYTTVTNSSASALTFSSNFGISGPFAFGGVGTCGLTLPSKGSCTISVVFKPTSTGSFTGAVMLKDNAGSGTQQIALSGSAS